MGCSASIPASTESDTHNKEINKQLAAEKRAEAKKKVIKLLLLGPGESGKSTILKQMKLVYGVPFTDQEMRSFKSSILQNLLTCFKTLIFSMDKLEIPYEFQLPTEREINEYFQSLPQTQAQPKGGMLTERVAQISSGSLLSQSQDVSTSSAEDLIPPAKNEEHEMDGRFLKKDDAISILAKRAYKVTGGTSLQEGRVAEAARRIVSGDTMQKFTTGEPIPQDLLDAMKLLWNDSGIQYCFSRSNEVQLMDCCSYVMTEIERLCNHEYQPSQQDILQTRVMTVTVTETRLKIESNEIRVFDVGGQRSERKKWAAYFEDATAVVFVAAISAYDQVLFEDEKTNRLVEALTLFKSICDHPLFAKMSFVLFLNKIDLFKEKIKSASIALYFPGYTGPDTYEGSSRYFIRRFEKCVGDRTFYSHLTWATDTGQTSIVLKAVTNTLLRSSIKDLGYNV